MSTIPLEAALTSLAIKRPIFHSEADFQHTLAWELRERDPECVMRLEYKPPHFIERAYLDIWARRNDTVMAIELKYKTRRLSVTLGEEDFDLKDQSAQDLGRYDFVKDLQRLEKVVSGRESTVGYGVFLTNDSAYWTPPRDTQTVDADFRVHQGRIVTGELRWGPGASAGTMHSREQAILLTGVYKFDWQDYSRPFKGPYGTFRYVVARVGGEPAG